MTETDENGANLRNALSDIEELACRLESKNFRIPMESQTAACGLREQAAWFKEAMKNQHDWDTVGMEECIGFMKTNVQKMLAKSEHKLILECAGIHGR